MHDPTPPEATIDAWVLTVPEDQEDEASGRAWTEDCSGITIEKGGPGQVRLVCFFADPEARAEDMRALAKEFDTTASRVAVPNPDWVQRFKETFVAFDVPPFRIVPEWVDEAPGADGNTAIPLRMDPGRAFGTGTHESTKLCLQTLGSIAASLPAAPRTLDLGCGTGILGIAAVKHAGARVIAADFDPLATSSAWKHAEMNGVNMSVVLMDGGRGLLPARFDLVFANLMAPFHIARAAEVTALGAGGCRFILAGLLRDEEAAVRAAWPSDWKVASTYQGEWASLLYERP